MVRLARLRSPLALHVVLGVGLASVGSRCTYDTEANLLTVRAVEPARIEPGRALHVTGAGFPPGRTCRVRLEGTMRRPGRVARQVRIELDAEAVSPERVEARFTGHALDELGGRGTLHGYASVVFPTADGSGAVVGRSNPLTLDVTRSSTQRMEEALALERRAGELLTSLGLDVDDEGPEHPGLPVTSVAEGSFAARAGLLPGDRILEANGVRAHATTDLLPPPNAEQLRLEMARQSDAASFTVVLPKGGEPEEVAPEARWTAQAALGWVLFVLLWLAPSAQVADWLGRPARRSSRTDRREPELRPTRGARVRAWGHRHGRRALCFAWAAVSFASLPLAGRMGILHVPLEAVVLGTLALRVSSAWLADPNAPRWRRLLDSAHAGAGAMAFGTAMTAVAALGGTTDLVGLEAQQGAAPWNWTVSRTPLGPLVMALVMIGATTAPRSIARGTSASARVARALDDVVLLAASATTTAVLLGGWGGGNATPSNAARAMVFVVLGTFVWSWMIRGRDLGRPTRKGAFAAACVWVIVAAGTVLRIVWEPPLALERGLAQVVGGAAALVVITAIARVLAGRVRSRPEPVHPFL